MNINRSTVWMMCISIAVSGCLDVEPVVDVKVPLGCEDNSDCPEGFLCKGDACVDPGRCGDGVVQPGEFCDDGESNTDAYSEGEICNTECLAHAPYCGDGERNGDEACDEGDANSDVYGLEEGCNLQCRESPYCGDGERNGNEACDEGENNDDGYSIERHCNANCSAYAAYCGDGILQDESEACDDGNRNNDDYCSSDCQSILTICGDGVKQGAEECDDGNTDDGDYCSANCGAETTVCGDSQQDGDEACDDGNTVDGDYCSANCGAVTTVCGDGIKEGAEECDDGNTDDGDYCSANCGAETTVCGDGQQEGDEVCDDGNTVDGDYCSANCGAATTVCGDGRLDDGEACDDGNTVDGDYCSANCGAATPVCGDGILQAGEDCDDGSNNSDDWSLTRHCNASCSGWAGYCGDGRTDDDEECDQGSGTNTNEYSGVVQVCNLTCDGYAPYCGDGDVTDGEACDSIVNEDGYNEARNAKCNADCSAIRPYCGDGIIDVEAEEICDDGGANTDAYTANEIRCATTCKAHAPRCGDAFPDAEETCDDGDDNSDAYSSTALACNADCSDYRAHCGDGVPNGGEQCDAGAQNNSDSYGDPGRCNASCSGDAPYCGDNYVNGGETCDLGAANSDAYGNSEGCLSTCAGPPGYCGDGIPNGGEVCDDGNTSNGDYCASNCLEETSVCGDDQVTGNEVCDDGVNNTSEAYTLSETCNATCSGITEFCGDGIVNGNEECDDGNQTDDGNGCSTSCTRLGSCGDGIVQYYFEDCDDSNTVTEACDYGEESCVVCVGPNYEDPLDPGNNSAGGCRFRERVGSYCGDGIIQQEGLEGDGVGGTLFTGTDTDKRDTGAWEGCDPGEDEAPIACSVLSPSLGSGTAICRSDCVGYDLSNCENQEQVYVPNGPFMMGCNEDLDGDCGCRNTTDYTCVEGSVNDEEAYHEVLVSQFLIDKYEASVSRYIECNGSDSSRCAAPTNNSDDYDDYSNFTRSGSRGNHPMNFLTYDLASEYCVFNNKRLPTEAEWEKAARGTDGRVFPWGEGLATCERAWVNDWYNTSCDDDGQGCTTGDDVTLMELDLGCGQGRTTNVASKSAFASPYGAVNMVGNASEWVADCYGASYYQSETMSYQNPQNVDECDAGDYGVLRGGSFSDKSRNLRTSYRRKHGMTQKGYKGFGVRCVQGIIPATGSVCGSEAILESGTVLSDYAGTNEGATNDWGENLSADRTYRWSPTVAGNYTFTLEADTGSSLDPKLRVINSTTCEEIHNEDDGKLTRPIGLGTWVLVADGQGGSEGAFKLSVRLCKAYQDLGSALGANLDVDGTTASGSGAADNYGDNESHRDRAYVWRAPATSYYQFDTDGSAFNTRLRLLDSECTQLAVNTDGGTDGASQLVEKVRAGEYRVLVVDGQGSGANISGEFDLNITQLCGNGTVDGDTDETCDDGNNTSGDGCSAECQSE